MEWLDREKELARLLRLTKEPEGGLAVLWGRRRVGKTRLLVEWVRRSQGVYFVADESSPSIQRRRFADVLEARLPGFGRVEYPNWGVLFERLARDSTQHGLRGPIIIDELPYLVAASPDLPAILQRFVDHDARQAKLIVALAGSSQRMMQGLVLDAGAPLFGRAREAFEVKPLPPAFLGPALRLRSPIAIVEAWSAWGGMPRYWELAASHRDRHEAVDALVLDPAGVLHDEPSRLLLEELPPAANLRPLLDAIGGGAHRASEIAGRVGVPVTSLSRALTRLMELGLVLRETPFGEPERSTKRALYRLADPFLRLWFQLVAPRRALLAQSSRAARLELFDARAPHLAASSWEELCRAATPRIAKLLELQLGPAERYWRGSGPEWDVAATSMDGRVTLVGEAKWTTERASATTLGDAYAALVRKGVPPFTRGRIVEALFIPTLPPRRPSMLPSHVHLIDARAVLDALS